MSSPVCAKCVSLSQTYYKATRDEYEPGANTVAIVASHAVRVRTRKAMIEHVKTCK